MDFREMAQKMILCALNCGLSSSSGDMYKKAVKRELDWSVCGNFLA